ncbi:glycosyltransferase family 1 protein [Bacillus carboniphilus]|uniref:Glycosyltransferase family 1 protein n=1 Tax=Bacillus carboniphilus TaxID=86663 RepID=A0ABY9JS33_9BACI|nr:glycosyltransferase family 1 protein [Bacillus carboniphilus]WLR41177.1 glycosyltransferase family 1 protein [Bacillus carboniphilus]
MKVAIFTDTYAPEVNGVAKTLKRFTDHLSKRGHLFKVFAPTPETKEPLSSNHIHHFTSFPFIFYPECRFAFPNMLSVKSQLQKFNPDIIHVATPSSVGLCGLHYAKKLNYPLVGSYHTNFDQYLEYYDLQIFSKILWKYMHWFHQPLEKIFVPSLSTKELLLSQDFQNIHIWSRGVNTHSFHPSKNKKQQLKDRYHIKQPYLLTYVGRLAPEKDIKTLLSIMKKLSSRSDVHWLIVGDGPSKSFLQERSPSNVTFTGYLSGEELAMAYASSDTFVFPSSTETFGNVVLESLASGTAVVTANAGGVKSIIQNRKTGVLCEPKETEDFTNAINMLLDHPSLRKQMEKEARNYALTQEWEQILDNLIDEYFEVINQKKIIKYA